MKGKRILLAVAVVWLGFLATPAGRPQDAVIRVSANLVAVPVSVLDGSGQPVQNLSAQDFRIEEEGRPQPVVSLGEPGKSPVDLVLMLDVSGSVRERFAFEQKAASNFLEMVLRPGDSVSVFSIGLGPKLVQGRSSSAEAAVAGVMALEPTKEATAFFESVVEAAHYAAGQAQPGARRVLLVISDGEDNNSLRHKLEDAIRELQRADCLFYSINPSGPSIRLNTMSMKGQAGMEAMAAETGGAFLVSTTEDLETALRTIANELQTQYLLGYYSRDERADGRFRRIAVMVPGRPELRVRARRGYFAPKG